MTKTVVYSTASLIVGVTLGALSSKLLGADLLSTRQDLDLVLTAPLTVHNGSGNKLVLPKQSTITVRSMYQDEATAVVKFVVDTAILKQRALPVDSDPTYFHGEDGQ